LGIADRIAFTGLLDDKNRLEVFSQSALLVCPSYRENFGMSVAEAMAAGLPVVVSNAVNIRDKIEFYGAGLVVPIDVDAIGGAILGLLQDPAARRRLGERGRSLVRENYGKSAVGTAMRAAIEGVL
jgi:glycosyltransferase involved in cell wall biosynthesis